MSRLAATVAVLASLALPGTAAAALRSLPVVEPQVVSTMSDHERYIAYLPSAGALRVLDTKTGRRSAIALPADCTLDDVHAGLMLIGCGQTYVTSRIVSAATGATVGVPGGPSSFVRYHRVGRNWVLGTERGTFYLNWHTGERRYPNRHQDLDSPNLGDYVHVRHDRVLGGRPGRPFYFIPAGRRRGVLLSRCPRGCRHGVGMRGHAAWTEGATLHGFALRTGRRCGRRLPRAQGEFSLPSYPNLSTPYILAMAIEKLRPGQFSTREIRAASWTGC
jgi:hypothetical protein